MMLPAVLGTHEYLLAHAVEEEGISLLNGPSGVKRASYFYISQ